MSNFREWIKTFEGKVIILIAVVAIGCAGGIFSIRHEASIRTDQFCTLIVARHNDIVDRYNDTQKYLATPAGQEKNGLNETVKSVSLPSLRRQAEVERGSIPKVCFSVKKVKTLPPISVPRR